jgi:DNA-binding response OmpR family regulator
MLGRVAATLDGRVVLVVEDEPLVGLDIAEMLKASGASVVPTRKVADAVAWMDRVEFSAAILDINLGGEDCSAVCQRLSERGIPFLFYTGYAQPPDGWRGIAIIGKPANCRQMIDAVERLCCSRQSAMADGQ